MLSYETQLNFKRNVIVKAYKNLSGKFDYIKRCRYSSLSALTGLPASATPEIQSTIGSPLQYDYRTKITPHFDHPARLIKKHGQPTPGERPEWFNIGFNKIGTKQVMDIEVSLPLLSLLVLAHLLPGMSYRNTRA